MDDPLDDGVNEQDLKAKMDESTFGGGESVNDESAVAQAFSNLIQELSQDDEIEMFTDLTASEIRHISVLQTAGDSITKQFVQHYMRQKISYRRRGRKELIDVSDAIGSKTDAEEPQGRIDKLRAML